MGAWVGWVPKSGLPNSIQQIKNLGKQFLEVGAIRNCPKTTPLNIYIYIKWMISLSLSLKNSVTQFYFLWKERQRELKKKSSLKRSERCLCYETKWFPFWLWFHSQPWVKIWMVKQFIIGFGIFQKVIQRLLTWFLTLVS